MILTTWGTHNDNFVSHVELFESLFVALVNVGLQSKHTLQNFEKFVLEFMTVVCLQTRKYNLTFTLFIWLTYKKHCYYICR